MTTTPSTLHPIPLDAAAGSSSGPPARLSRGARRRNHYGSEEREPSGQSHDRRNRYSLRACFHVDRAELPWGALARNVVEDAINLSAIPGKRESVQLAAGQFAKPSAIGRDHGNAVRRRESDPIAGGGPLNHGIAVGDGSGISENFRTRARGRPYLCQLHFAGLAPQKGNPLAVGGPGPSPWATHIGQGNPASAG